MSASRPFQGDTGEGVISRRSGSAVAAAGRKSAPRGAHPVCRGKVTKSSAIPPPPARFFLHRRAVVRCAPRPLLPPRLRRSKSCAFFVLSSLFFRRSPALFSFGGRVALLRGVKCAVPRARIAHPSATFRFFAFTASPTPRNALTVCTLRVKALRFRLHLGRHFCTAVGAVSSRRNGQGAKLANSC